MCQNTPDFVSVHICRITRVKVVVATAEIINVYCRNVNLTVRLRNPLKLTVRHDNNIIFVLVKVMFLLILN